MISVFDRLAHGVRPILVGPWLSEVGFELLYWIPFLRKQLADAGIGPERVWILSRGGCRSWYQGLADHYVELFDLLTPAELIRRNGRRIAEQGEKGRTVGLRQRQRTAKQFLITDIELDLIDQAADRAGLEDPLVLHPSVMYQAFRPLWRAGKAQLRDRFEDWAAMQRFSLPVKPAGLPDRYIAVKFYASQACPADGLKTALVESFMKRLSSALPVVLLHQPHRYDEHGEFPILPSSRIHIIPLEPATNLDTQTAVIAHADRFIGTYGGFAYLAPCLGIRTTAVYVRANFRRDHLILMKHLAQRILRVDFTLSGLSHGGLVLAA